MMLSGKEQQWFLHDGDLVPSEWESVPWVKTEIPGQPSLHTKVETGRIIWLRTIVQVDSIPSTDLDLRLGIVSDRDTVYWNDHVIGGTGTFDSPAAQAYDRIRLYNIDRDLIRPGGNNLLIRVQAYMPGEIGIVQDRVEIGPAGTVSRRLFWEESVKLVLLAGYCTAAGYFLFLFLRRRKDVENLFFALFALSLVLYSFLRNQAKYELGLSFYAMKKVEFQALIMIVPFFVHFIRTYYRAPWTRFIKILDILTVAIALAFLFGTDFRSMKFIFRIAVIPIWIGYVSFSIITLAKQVFAGDRDAKFIAVGTFIMVVAAVLDVLSDNQVLRLPRLTGYAFLFFVLSLATVLANRFVRINEQVEGHAETLETRVQERTRELQESHRRIEHLKDQQDADYFLTSLLLRPLGTNRTEDGPVQIDYLVHQKKRFQFRDSDLEIGGDICMADVIELGGVRYVAFVNGDAMGKSLQGAGGILVFGSLYRSILERSKSIEAIRQYTPDRWLRMAVLDIHSAFVAFDGSMMASAFMSLIAEESGIMYYVVAEHPRAVILRDGSATFLGSDDSVFKLGMPLGIGELRIQSEELQHGDIIVVGSDGRDDILVGPNKDLNVDENLFPSFVAHCGGDLQKIHASLLEMGELTDDLSLLRISFANTKLAGKEERRLHQVKQKAEIREAVASQDWIAAARAVDVYLKEFPLDTQILLVASRVMRRAGNLERAIDLAEQLRSRSPQRSDVLQHLARLYAMRSRQSV